MGLWPGGASGGAGAGGGGGGVHHQAPRGHGGDLEGGSCPGEGTVSTGSRQPPLLPKVIDIC